jgi:nucleotide-binding universal stress UspA family protein
MKTILVTTDYSATAENAMRYAVELAKFEKAKIILFHSYIPRVLLSSLTLMNGGFEEENLNKLEHYKWEFNQKYGSTPEIEVMVSSGFTVNRILKTIKERKIDLVVMGTTGAGLLKKVLLGNTTTNIIQSSEIPVLVIPKNVQFKIPKKIAVALSQIETIPEGLKKQIINYVKEFDASLTVFNILGKESHVLQGSNNEDDETNEMIDGLKYDSFQFSGNNPIEVLNNYIVNQKIDWLIMAPQDHPQLSALFYNDNTQEMAFHTHIPLLSVHI